MSSHVAALRLLGWVAAACCIAATASAAGKPDRRVAMLCDRDTVYHNQYVDAAGRWVSDLQFTGGCLHDPDDIADFCRRVYPGVDVVRVRQAPDGVLVDSWCQVDLGACSESVWVRPYECLTTEASSDRSDGHRDQGDKAGKSDEHSCQSDQISNASRCWNKQQWRSEAFNTCQKRSMSLTSLFPVYPCGADVFTGVDFECCPFRQSDATLDSDFDLADILEDDELFEEYDDDDEDVFDDENEEEEDIEDEVDDIEADVLDTGTRDPYYTKFDPRIEHDAYKGAIRRLGSSYRDKSAKIMNEWNELEKHYQTLKKTNNNKADEFKVKMTDRFQKLVNILKSRDTSEKYRLRSLHQQRMTAHVENLKRDSMACYNRSLSAPTPTPATVHRCLRKLLRSLYRDRHHTISHYQHLKTSQPEQANSERQATIDHLHEVERIVDQSIKRLDRFPQVKFMIMPEITQQLGRLERRDSVPVDLQTSPYHSKTSTASATTITSAVTTRINDAATTPGDNIKTPEMPNAEVPNTPPPPHIMQDDQMHLSADSVSIEVHTAPAGHSEHVTSHSRPLALSQTGTYRVSVHHTRYGRGFYLGVGLAALGVVVVVVVVAMTVRRRHSPQHHGFIEVDQPVHVGEAHHLDHLQVNGYENPTYKYYDK